MPADNDDDKEAMKFDKPEGSKKANERLKMDTDVSLLRDKFDQMMKSKEAITMKTLETKLAITERKK
jgi:hypothetical protein